MTAVVIIDPRVSNYEVLLSGLAPDTDILLLDPGQDGPQQIASHLQGRSNIDALHILSHGAAGTLYLGNTVLNLASLEHNSDLWQRIGQSLTEIGDILLYGCDVAAGEVGQQFIAQLAQYTGADVAASVDATGLAVLGGNWDLEVQTGPIEATSLSDTSGSFTGVLGTGIRWDIQFVTSRTIIRSSMKRLGVGFEPIFHGLERGFATQDGLGEFMVVQSHIALQGRPQVLP